MPQISVPSALAGARSPFDNPAILWLLVATGLYVLYPAAGFRDVVTALRLPDTDDAMRLVQVRDLLAGQGWFDMIQHRLMPPGGAAMHWSRLIDAPLAGLIAGASPLVGRPLAEGLVAALWPPALFCLYLALVYRAVASRFGFRAAMLALFAATQAGGLGGLFAFGRIDHHNVQVLLVLGLGLALADPARSRAKAGLAGLCAALSLAVGLEALPFIALAGLFVLGDWVRSGRTALGVLTGFSVGLALSSLVLFAGQTAPGLWLTTECDALSPPWLWLAGAGAGCAIGANLVGSRLTTPLRRAGLAGLIGAATVAGFTGLFPSCLSGPFRDLPGMVRTQWLEQVLEMQPFRALVVARPADALAYVAPLFLASLIAGVTAMRGPPALRRAAGITALFLFTGFCLAQFQFRGIYVASGFIALVAGPVLDRAILLLRGDASVRRGAALLGVALLLVAKVWAVPFSLLDAIRGGTGEGGSPVAAWQDCTARNSLVPLGAVEPGTVLAEINLGPSLLVHTPHAVVAGPYHRAIPGLVASIEGLNGDEAALRHALRASGATYLAVCRRGDGDTASRERPFAERLAEGSVTVPWLEPVPLGRTPLVLWRVRQDE